MKKGKHKLCPKCSSGIKSKDYSLKRHICIEGKGGTFLRYGRVVLLERIKQYGSISEASGLMEMSYRHTWEIVDSMNRQASTPVVVT